VEDTQELQKPAEQGDGIKNEGGKVLQGPNSHASQRRALLTKRIDL
jgi:hypothetical protein